MVNIAKLPDNYSVFSKEYDYIISLGHRCCTALSAGYARKSSFPLDWQITDINILEDLFNSEFVNFYPDSGVSWVHLYNGIDENGNDTGIVDHEKTKQIFERRCKRLMDLIKRGDRRLLFVRNKYRFYWCKSNHPAQIDQNSVQYDIDVLSRTMNVIKNKFNNNNIDCLYIYSDFSDDDAFDGDPVAQKKGLQWNEKGEVDPKDLVMQEIVHQIELAKKFTYTEINTNKNIHAVEVGVLGRRVEAMSYTSQIFNQLKISDIEDFK